MINNTTSRNRRALLVGVNKYPNLPDFSQLRGCVNDVTAMKQTLETSFHFPPENITVLCDERATAKGIRDAMDRLVLDCGPDDIVVFHYSGHGSQMPALGDKPRGYDESIMPYDSGRMNPTWPKQVPPCDIRDTDIQEWLGRLTKKTSNVTLIFDSCHSGSITRMQDDDDEGTRLRWIEPDPLPTNARAACGHPDLKGEPVGASGWLVTSEKYVLLAACAAEQGAYELDAPGDETTVRHGAFTYFLTQEISHATENTYQDVWDMVAVKVNNRFQKQTPQLEGARNRRIFNVDDFTPMSYLLITERRGNEVVLSGGLIHGVTVDSRWAVYPPGTKHATDAEQLGELKIRSVTSTGATAVVVEERDANAIAPGARAIDTVHVDAEARMSVYVAPAPKGYERWGSQLRRCLEQSSLLTTAKAKKNARVVISIDGTSSWLVKDQSQSQLMDQYPVDDNTSSFRIRDNLETIWRYQKVLELRNESSSLKGKVDFELRKRGADGTWEPVRDDAVFKDGESIAFRVTNRSGITIHVSVLDLGLSKRIGLLHPPASASEMLAAGRSSGGATDVETTGVLIVGERAEDEIELSFPENVSFLSNNGHSNGHLRGKEIFKLCVTTDRHDLGFLKQSGIRMEKAAPRPGLEELIYSAMGENTREARRKTGPRDEWLTIERSFWLKSE